MLAFMDNAQTGTLPPDIPKQIFGTFLGELKKAGIPEELVQRLHKTLIEENGLTENAIRSAIFPDSHNP